MLYYIIHNLDKDSGKQVNMQGHMQFISSFTLCNLALFTFYFVTDTVLSVQLMVSHTIWEGKQGKFNRTACSERCHNQIMRSTVSTISLCCLQHVVVTWKPYSHAIGCMRWVIGSPPVFKSNSKLGFRKRSNIHKNTLCYCIKIHKLSIPCLSTLTYLTRGITGI